MYERILPDSGREPTEEEVLNAEANMTDAQVEGDELRQEAIKQVHEAGQECGLSDEETKEALSTLAEGKIHGFSVVIKGIPVLFDSSFVDDPLYRIYTIDGESIIDENAKDQLSSKYGKFLEKLMNFLQMQNDVKYNVLNENSHAKDLAKKLEREQEKERVAKAVQKLLD